MVIITTVVVMYLIDGFTAKSICAIVGTIIGVVLAAVLHLYLEKYAIYPAIMWMISKVLFILVR